MNKVIDCFQFADEAAIAEIRLSELYDVVDQFCIVESCFDQCGNHKEYNFEMEKKRFLPFYDKITYLKISDRPPVVSEFDWGNEIYVRESLRECVTKYSQEKRVKIEANTKILFSDCDEIVNKNALLKALNEGREILSFNHLFGCYKLDIFSPNRNWYGACLVDAEVVYRYGFQRVRAMKDHLYHFDDAENQSWHFSGVGEDAFSTNFQKWKTRIEPRDKTFLSEINKENLKNQFLECFARDRCFFFCDNPDDRSIKLKTLDFNLLPEYVKANRDKFSGLLAP